MSRQAALLRGVNVGGRNAVPMVALRELFVSLGHFDVATLGNSGNVVFTSTELAVSTHLEAAVFERFDVACTVVVVERSSLDLVVAENPFTGLPPATVHAGFLAARPEAGAMDAFDAVAFAPEELVVRDRVCYLHLPGGMGRAKMPPSLERRLRVPITYRNWATVTTLAEIARR
ncbi:MAG: DUF1697 domain-containing protein [Acidimicrobiales bacterium]